MTPQEIALKEKIKQEKIAIVKEDAQRRAEENQKREEQHKRDYAEFIASGDRVRTYEAYPDASPLRAKHVLQQFAYDADSIQDIRPLTQCVRTYIREYPNVRYAIQVQYMTKNIFGVPVSHNGVVLLDQKFQGVGILDSLP